MSNRDAAEHYLAEVYASPVPAPERQLRWARALDAAQHAFTQALADDAGAVRALVERCRSPEYRGTAPVLARWARPAAGAGVPGEEDAQRQFTACLDALEGMPQRPDAFEACLDPVRLRTEFMAALLADLRAPAQVRPETLTRLADCLTRIRAATGRLVCANQRLVATLARQYRNGPLAFMDLVQEGNIGLLRAIERFDPGHGTRVSTYALWWVRRAMVYAIARQGRDVRPSVGQYWAAREVSRTQDRLEREDGRRASQRDLAQRLGMSVGEVQRHLGMLAPTLALDAPIAGGAEAARIDRLTGPAGQDPEDAAHAEVMRRGIGELLAQLPERQAQILRLRFGIGVREEHTLEQIARQQGVTRERIRQLEAQALNALRRLDAAWALRGCLG